MLTQIKLYLMGESINQFKRSKRSGEQTTLIKKQKKFIEVTPFTESLNMYHKKLRII